MNNVEKILIIAREDASTKEELALANIIYRVEKTSPFHQLDFVVTKYPSDMCIDDLVDAVVPDCYQFGHSSKVNRDNSITLTVYTD